MKWRTELAAELHGILGDADNETALMSYKAVVELDETEAFQHHFVDTLLKANIHHYYVPKEYGGRFENYEQLYTLGKLLSARDLSTTISMSTMIWTTIVWLQGTPSQQRSCAELTLSGNGAPCLAYTEEEHGSDLIANSLSAKLVGNSYRLNGEKWPINRATQSEVVILLAKTGDKPGPRSMSLFYFPKNIEKGNLTHLNRVKTLGLRGCDISGLRFSNTDIPLASRIGGEGEGIEGAIKAFQVTRTLCAALSIGVLEGNLKIVTEFALERKLYDARVFDIPNAKYHLASAFTDLLLVDALGTSASRALHYLPQEFSVLSAVTKFAAPYWLDQSHTNLATVLGARFFLREKHKHGMFQKNLRDSKVVALFDGSSEVNLYSLTTQLPALAKKQLGFYAGNLTIQLPELGHVYCDEVYNSSDTDDNGGGQLPKFDGTKLDLSSHGLDSIMLSFPNTLKLISNLPDSMVVRDQLYGMAELMFYKHTANMTLLANKGEARIKPRSPQLFKLAKQYCLVHLGVAAMNFWLHNQDHKSPFIRRGHWLVFALQRLLSDLNVEADSFSEQNLEEIALELQQRTQSKQSYQLNG